MPNLFSFYQFNEPFIVLETLGRPELKVMSYEPEHIAIEHALLVAFLWSQCFLHLWTLVILFFAFWINDLQQTPGL